jgi:hypothetical protein
MKWKSRNIDIINLEMGKKRYLPRFGGYSIFVARILLAGKNNNLKYHVTQC